MDGNFHFPNGTPLDRPVLMLGKPSHVPTGPDPTWDEIWTELTGWKRWLSVEDTEHLSFTDLAPLAKQLGIPLQVLDGDRSDAITRAYVAAFVNTHLRGRITPLLDGPSARFPGDDAAAYPDPFPSARLHRASTSMIQTTVDVEAGWLQAG